MRKYAGIDKDDPLSPASNQLHQDMSAALSADKVPTQKKLYNALCKGARLPYRSGEIDALKMAKAFLEAQRLI